MFLKWNDLVIGGIIFFSIFLSSITGQSYEIVLEVHNWGMRLSLEEWSHERNGLLDDQPLLRKRPIKPSGVE